MPSFHFYLRGASDARVLVVFVSVCLPHAGTAVLYQNGYIINVGSRKERRVIAQGL